MNTKHNLAGIWGLLGIISLATVAHAADESITTKGAIEDQRKFRYDLVMSKDDAICNPVALTYNDLLTKETNKFLSAVDREESGESTRFDDQGAALANSGFTALVPKNIELSGEVVSLYAFNFFGDNQTRVIAKKDYEAGESVNTEIMLLKQDTDVDSIKEQPILNDSASPIVGMARSTPAKHLSEELDPSIIDFNLGSEQPYVLKNWPHFHKISDYYNSSSKNGILPSIDQTQLTRIFAYKDRAYFFENEWTKLPFRSRGPSYEQSTKSIVLVYTLSAAGRDDVCYLNLVPTQFAYKMQQESK